MANPFQFVLAARQAGQTAFIQEDGQPLDVEALSAGLPVPILPPLAPQPAALQGTILIDPQNTTGVATATGANTATVGSFTGRVFSSFANLVTQWGTLWPVLTLTTSLVWVSSHTDNTDPVVWYPIIRGGVTVSIQGGPPTVVATGVVLSSTVAKSRAFGTNSTLETNLTAAGAVGQLVENTTHPSRAWVYASLGSNNFQMTQPMVKATVGGTPAPAEVDTWANGDTVNLLVPLSVNVVDVEPVFCDYHNTIAGAFFYYNLTLFAAEANQYGFLGKLTAIYECCNRKELQVFGAFGLFFTNCLHAGAGSVGVQAATAIFYGGAINASSLAGISSSPGTTVVLDGDFILGHAMTVPFAYSGSVRLGFVFLDAVLTTGASAIVEQVSYGGAVIYGSDANSIALQGSAHLAQLQGTFVATFTAPGLAPQITMNNATTASNHTGASPDVLNDGITTSAANLDLAVGSGGFGGNAFKLGGSSVTNFV
jgi:hypothetical protein